jgi:DNA-binding response OmpR family regulator
MYSPSILIIQDDSAQTFELKQKLESAGCQVHQIDASPASLSEEVRQMDFELIVLNIEQLTVDNELCKKFKADSRLATPPTVILIPLDCPKDVISGLELPPPVYHFAKNVPVAERLLPIIKETHYMNYRYMWLST